MLPDASRAKLPLANLYGLMTRQHAQVARQMYQEYESSMTVIPGSSQKHQTWPGGYVSHIEEAMNIGLVLYDELNLRRTLTFSRSAVLFCIFLHDFDKVLRYTVLPNGNKTYGSYSNDYVDQTAKILKHKFNYVLDPEEYNALKYAHGEGDDYHPSDRIMLPLATIVHCADVISARVWYDEGQIHDRW